MRLKLTIAYDGTAFRGWARQPGERTAEAVVLEALGRLYGSVGELTVAGRTDTGVHALANVVSVDVESGPPVARAASALNGVLPEDLSVLAAEEAEGFDARYDAISRSYRYRVFTRSEPSPFEARRALWHPRPLDLDALGENVASIVGRHDFRAFTPSDTRHSHFVRTVAEAAWNRGDDDLATFEITADSFLRHMVRTLIGTMLEGIDVAPLLDGSPRSAAGKTAPAHGLYLVSVGYK